jgi:hypothetical protein
VIAVHRHAIAAHLVIAAHRVIATRRATGLLDAGR